MATRKYTAKRGGKEWEVTAGSGSSISGGEAVEVNFDFTDMTQAEAINALEAVKQRILSSSSWPPA